MSAIARCAGNAADELIPPVATFEALLDPIRRMCRQAVELREYQRQAGDLLKGWKEQDPDAIRLVRGRHPRFLRPNVPWLLAGHENVVRLLVERGARLDIKDTIYETTPLGWALYGKQEEVAE